MAAKMIAKIYIYIYIDHQFYQATACYLSRALPVQRRSRSKFCRLFKVSVTNDNSCFIVYAVEPPVRFSIVDIGWRDTRICITSVVSKRCFISDCNKQYLAMPAARREYNE